MIFFAPIRIRSRKDKTKRAASIVIGRPAKLLLARPSLAGSFSSLSHMQAYLHIWGGRPASRLYLQDIVERDAHRASGLSISSARVGWVWLLVLKRRWLIAVFSAAVAVAIVLDWIQG